jgi:hypothetical protein
VKARHDTTSARPRDRQTSRECTRPSQSAKSGLAELSTVYLLLSSSTYTSSSVPSVEVEASLRAGGAGGAGGGESACRGVGAAVRATVSSLGNNTGVTPQIFEQ